MEWLKDIPITPPDEALNHLYNKNCMNTEAIIYKAAREYEPLTETNVRVAECHCTACERTFYQQYLKGTPGCHGNSEPPGFFNEGTMETVESGSVTICPVCGTQLTVYHSSAVGRKRILERVYPVTVHAIGGKLVLLQWYFEKYITNSGDCEITKEPYEGYVVDGKKMIKLVGYRRYMSYISFFGHWEPLKRCVDTLAGINKDWIAPFDPALLGETNAANSKLDIYMQSGDRIYPVTYLRLWQKHKNIENLIMQGAGGLVTDMIKDKVYYTGCYGQTRQCRSNIDGVNWKENRPAQMLGLSKDEFKTCIQEHWTNQKLKFWLYAKENKADIKITDLKDCEQFKFAQVEKLIDSHRPVMKSIRYLQKQIVKYVGNIDVSTLIDYWDMAEKVGDDMTDPQIIFPQNLLAAHDSAMDRFKIKENEVIKAQFEKRFGILNLFSWSNDQFMIFPARSAKDLVYEGKRLHHCVARYVKDHANGKTAIFFIRCADKPSTPYYTLELDEKTLTVRQNRGNRNCSRTDEIREFETKWLEHIREITSNKRKAG